MHFGGCVLVGIGGLDCLLEWGIVNRVVCWGCCVMTVVSFGVMGGLVVLNCSG